MGQRYFRITAITFLILILLGLSNVRAEKRFADESKQLNQQISDLKRQGRFKDAIPLAQRALKSEEDWRGQLPESPLFWIFEESVVMAMRNLAGLYYAIDDHGQAVSLMERAQKMEVNNGKSLSVHALGDPLAPAYNREQDLIPELRSNVDVNISLSLTATGSRAKALGLTEVLQYKSQRLNARSRVAQSLPHSDRTQALLANSTQELSAILFRGPSDDHTIGLHNYFTRLGPLAGFLEEVGRHELTGQNTKDKNKIDFTVFQVDSERVRKNLPANGVLVEWFRYRPFDPKAKEESTRWGEPHYAAYVLKPTSDVVGFDLGAAQPIDALVTKFREALDKGHNVTNVTIDGEDVTYREVARSLFNKLIAPLESHLGPSEQLLLSPDGALNLIPFAALLDKDGRYLIQRYEEITYLLSGADLLHMANKSIARDGPVVVANPSYGLATSKTVAVAPNPNGTLPPKLDSSRLTFSPLDGVEAEGIAVALLLDLDDTHVLLGNKATETRLMGLHGPKILHLGPVNTNASYQRLTRN